MLKHISNILAQQVENAGLVSRWDGEEFLIALSNCSKEGAQTILEDIRLSIANSPFESEQICIPLTSTIGATSLSDFNIHKNLST